MGRSGTESATRLVSDAAARRIEDTSLSLRFQCWWVVCVWINSRMLDDNDDEDGRTTAMISSIISSISIRTRVPNASRKHQSHSRLVLVRKKLLRAVGTVSCSQSRRRAPRIALTEGGGPTRELPTTTEDRRIDKVVASTFLPTPDTNTQ